MALIECKECGNQVSSKAEKCPHCGVAIPKESNMGAAMLMIFLCVGFIVYVVAQTEDSPPQPQSSSAAPASAKPISAASFSTLKPWYAGGTLHNATVKEWNMATYENRLATSADYVVKLLQVDGQPVPPIDQVKPLAVNMERGLSQLAKTDEENGYPDEKVSAIAAGVWAVARQLTTHT